jgi:hypothetical protein
MLPAVAARSSSSGCLRCSWCSAVGPGFVAQGIWGLPGDQAATRKKCDVMHDGEAVHQVPGLDDAAIHIEAMHVDVLMPED